MESLATNPPAHLGVVDLFSRDPDLLRYIGQIVLEEPELRKQIIHRPDIQRRIKMQWPDDRQELPDDSGIAS